MVIHYFGTPLNSAGHGFRVCNETYLGQSDFRYEVFSKQHFCPETIADKKIGKENGDTFYFVIGKYKICYIEGSCSDSRGGSKSVFFTDEKIIFGEFIVKLVSMPVIKKMIKQMPFEVRWNLNEEFTKKVKDSLNSN